MVAEKDGTYQFGLYSDDGSELYVNNIQVINHGGIHALSKRAANVSLLKGEHQLKLRYFQNFGQKGLILSVKRPGVSFEELLDSSLLK
jgi:hypothetical protein